MAAVCGATYLVWGLAWKRRRKEAGKQENEMCEKNVANSMGLKSRGKRTWRPAKWPLDSDRPPCSYRGIGTLKLY